MPSLIDRVTSFGRSPQGRSLIQKATDRFSGGSNQKRRGKDNKPRGRRGR
jgi:hypothetical protein